MESEHDPARPRFLDLGVLAIEANGTEQRVGGRQLATILGVLLVDADRHVSADRLLDALWPDGSGSTSTLDSHLFRLRKLLEPARRRGAAPTVLLSEPRGYRLVVSATQVDSLRFEQLVSDAVALHRQDQSARALRRCDEALALWRGTPYTPVEDQEWAVSAVGRLTERLAQVSELRLTCLLGVGDPGTALAESSRLVTEHPLREGIWAARMLAAYRTGRSDLALQTYSTARMTLRDELGLEPGPELRRLQSRILAADPELIGVAPKTPTVQTRPVEVRLPSVRTAIIGRDGDLGRLESELTTHELVTLVGPAGCGKTRLAIETGRRGAPEFPDGVYFVSLIGAGDRGQLLDEVTSGLGVAAAPAGSPTDALREFCAGRRMLLILDNCEHILDEVADLVDSLLVPDTELTVLATSRVPLDLDGEIISTLLPLPVPDPTIEVDEVGAPVSSTAVQLFLERLRVADPSAATAPDLSVVNRICRDVDGLPLAIELAAARARSFSLEEIAAQTAADPGSLSRVGREHPDHHDSVRHAIEWSYRTLDPEASDLHRRIALLPGPFTPDLASALTHLDRSTTVHRLAELVHCSMLVPLGPRRPGRPSRFTQLATVRSHGLQAQRRDEAVDVRGQKIAWVEDLLDRKPRVGTNAETGWFAEVDDNLAALRATLQDALVERPHPVGAAITHRLSLFWYYRGMIIEGLRWLRLATQSPAATPFDRWMAHLSMAGQLCMQTRLDLAMPYFAVALDDPRRASPTARSSTPERSSRSPARRRGTPAAPPS